MDAILIAVLSATIKSINRLINFTKIIYFEIKCNFFYFSNVVATSVHVEANEFKFCFSSSGVDGVTMHLFKLRFNSQNIVVFQLNRFRYIKTNSKNEFSRFKSIDGPSLNKIKDKKFFA